MMRLVLAGAALLAVLVCVGYLGAAQPYAYLAAGAVCAVLGIAAAARRWPRQALSLTPLLVVIAETKYRSRDPLQALSGHVDIQIVVELGLYALLALLVLMALLSREFKSSRLRRPEWGILGFALFALASTAWSSYQRFTFVRGAQAVILVAVLLVAVRVMEPGRFVRAMTASISGFVLVITSITLLFPFARGPSMGAGGAFRFAWFGVHSITVGSTAAIGTLLLLGEMLFSRPGARPRWLGVPLWVPAGLQLMVLVATNSRGPLLAFLAAACCLLSFRFLRAAGVFSISAAAVAGVLLYVNVNASASSLLSDAANSQNPVAVLLMRGQSARQIEGLTGRVNLWRGLLPLIEESPIVGYGYQASRPLILDVAEWAGQAHNAYLQSILDLGIVGALLLWVPMLVVMWLGFHQRAIFRTACIWQGPALFALIPFELLNSVSNGGIAASPGLELMSAVTCIVIGSRFWLRAEQPGAVPDPMRIRVNARSIAAFGTVDVTRAATKPTP